MMVRFRTLVFVTLTLVLALRPFAVPTAADDAIIANGDTVTVDTAAVALSVTVGQGASGTLQWDAATARSLTVGGNVTVAAGGTFQSDPVGTVATHALSLGGSLTNN